MRDSSNKRSWWKTAESVVTVTMLVVSVAINIMQCSQTQASQREAEKESKKSEAIQRQRDEWVRNLKWELRETRTAIRRLRQDSLLYRPEPWYESSDDDEARRRRDMATTVNHELHNLQLREKSLEQQIISFLSYK